MPLISKRATGEEGKKEKKTENFISSAGRCPVAEAAVLPHTQPVVKVVNKSEMIPARHLFDLREWSRQLACISPLCYRALQSFLTHNKMGELQHIMCVVDFLKRRQKQIKALTMLH